LGGFVRDFQAGLMGELADIGLGQAGFPQRGEYGEFAGGILTRAEIPRVVGIFPIGHGGEFFPSGQTVQLAEELVFAKIAAVDGIGLVTGIAGFLRFDDAEGELVALGEIERFLQFGTFQAGGVGDGTESGIAQNLNGPPKEDGAVDASGVGHKEGGVGPEERVELL
jgi:hypothetical protein